MSKGDYSVNIATELIVNFICFFYPFTPFTPDRVPNPFRSKSPTTDRIPNPVRGKGVGVKDKKLEKYKTINLIKMDNLQFGRFYHVYNHGVGGRDIFSNTDNYEYFFSLYDKYIGPIAQTYAWVLMKNHFHFLIQCKEDQEIVAHQLRSKTMGDSAEGQSIGRELELPPDPKILSNQFSKLFNAYAQAFNKYHATRGTLFERPFRRKLIEDEDYLKNLVVYIHNNPVYHGFCKHPSDYQWSSYLSCISDNSERLNRIVVISWFENVENFKYVHDQKARRNNWDPW